MGPLSVRLWKGAEASLKGRTTVLLQIALAIGFGQAEEANAVTSLIQEVREGGRPSTDRVVPARRSQHLAMRTPGHAPHGVGVAS